jgi:hypothetical protein
MKNRLSFLESLFFYQAGGIRREKCSHHDFNACLQEIGK